MQARIADCIRELCTPSWQCGNLYTYVIFRYTGCFNKMCPFENIYPEKPRVLESVCITSLEYQILQVLFDTSHDDFGWFEAELQPFY